MWEKMKYNIDKFFSHESLFGISQPSERKYILVPEEKRDEATLMQIMGEHFHKSCKLKTVGDFLWVISQKPIKRLRLTGTRY